MMLPVFVKGHLSFCLEKQDLEFIHQNISVFGVTGLPWGPLNPRDHFGKEVMASIRITSPEHLSILTRAEIMRENTIVGEHMGIKFRFEKESLAKLAALIKRHGFYPTEYLRKYPRIPANVQIQTFPLRALVYPEGGTPNNAPLIFDIGNLSPNGILLHTENQAALNMRPGDRLNLLLEPRGWFPMSIRVQALICRISDEMSPHSGNLIRYLGIKFTKVDDVNRTAFLDLLKDILAKIKTTEGGAPAPR
jgi:hypothetical protein